MNRRYRTVCILAVCIFILVPLLALAGISNSKHNLSASGPGPVKALSESQICIFCHTPHNASPSKALWNQAPPVNHINYWSPTLKSYRSQAEAPPIDGFSKLCLGCHDGTVALGSALRRQEDIQMFTVEGVVDASGKLLPGAEGHVGTDLSGSHPISIVFDEALVARRNSDRRLMHLKWPIADRDVRLYPTQGGRGVQCTSCHEPHDAVAGGEGTPPFWQKATYEEVCLVCHDL